MVIIAYTCLVPSMTLRAICSVLPVCEYFLMAVLWALIYQLVLIFTPNAFVNMGNEITDCLYYSFATLTTLGPGDITPVSTWAKFLAILETFIGQVYLATFIARLVALSIMRKQ
jgi:voltage-gated potassium channel